MDRTSVVLETQIELEGETFTASYFVDPEGVIHANIGGKVMLAPTTHLPADAVVKSLLTGHILKQSRKYRLTMDWSRS